MCSGKRSAAKINHALCNPTAHALKLTEIKRHRRGDSKAQLEGTVSGKKLCGLS